MSQQRQGDRGETVRSEGERGERDATERGTEGPGGSRQSRADGGAAENQGQGRDRNRNRGGTEFTDWLASTAIRTTLVIAGVVILLFALGQLVGIDLLGLTAEALSSEIGRWLLIAAFGVVLIVLAQRGFRSR